MTLRAEMRWKTIAALVCAALLSASAGGKDKKDKSQSSGRPTGGFRHVRGLCEGPAGGD